MWKKLSSKTVFEHPRLTLIEDEVELPSGKRTTYLLRKPGDGDAVTILARNAEGKFLVEKEYSYPPDTVLYQLPGGAVKPEEKLESAANRELMEEAKYSATQWKKLGSFYTDNRRSDHLMHVFLAEDLHDDPLPHDEEEVITTEWKSAEEIDALIRKGEILNVHMLAAWALFQIVVQK